MPDPHDAAGSIDAIVGPRVQKVIQGIDDFMNWLVFEGIPNAAGKLVDNVKENMSKGVAYIDNKTYSHHDNSTQKSEPAAIARSAQTPELVQTPALPEHVKTAAMGAGMGNAKFEAFHVDANQVFAMAGQSALVAPSVGQSQSQSIGIS